uniref:hypothetical protein n=1 Tax=Candidatus Fimivicinus sp. TaxID=3056640 RepID=UPI003FEE0FB9
MVWFLHLILAQPEGAYKRLHNPFTFWAITHNILLTISGWLFYRRLIKSRASVHFGTGARLSVPLYFNHQSIFDYIMCIFSIFCSVGRPKEEAGPPKASKADKIP